MNKQFKLQKISPKDYNGLVNEQHLGSLYMTQPIVVDQTIKQLYPISNERAISSFMEKFPVMEVATENGFYEWMLQGNHEKNIPLVDWETVDGTKPEKVGVAGAQFYMFFPEPYFEDYNVIKSDKNEYQLVVMGMEPDGANFKYRVELIRSSDDFFMPAGLLATGTRWSKFYQVNPDTLSDRGQRPNFTSPFRMRNRMGSHRFQYEVTGSMIEQGKNYPLLMTFPNGSKTFINYQDIVAHAQFTAGAARKFIYGLSNFDQNDFIYNRSINSKYPVGNGAGFFEQISPSNVHYMNILNLDFMADLVHELSLNRVAMTERVVTLMTGEYGMKDFHQAILAKGGTWVTNIGARLNDKVISGTDAPVAGIKNPMAVGGQFVEWYAYNGINFKLVLNPMFDDRIHFPEMHPLGGTVESRRMVVLGFGGEPNVYRTRPKGSAPIHKYIPGLRDPYSPAGSKMNPGMTVSPVDGYEVHGMDWVGCMVKDPTVLLDFQINLA
jgi:hypothetical protein